MPTQPYVGSEAQGVAVTVGSEAIRVGVHIKETGVVPMQPDGSAAQGVGAARGVGVAARAKEGQSEKSVQSRKNTRAGFLLKDPEVFTTAGEVCTGGSEVLGGSVVVLRIVEVLLAIVGETLEVVLLLDLVTTIEEFW